jgi:hypothetical protein
LFVCLKVFEKVLHTVAFIQTLFLLDKCFPTRTQYIIMIGARLIDCMPSGIICIAAPVKPPTREGEQDAAAGPGH